MPHAYDEIYLLHVCHGCSRTFFLNVFHGDGFSLKMFKQIVHPIYQISQLNVLYRIVSNKLAKYTALVFNRTAAVVVFDWFI